MSGNCNDHHADACETSVEEKAPVRSESVVALDILARLLDFVSGGECGDARRGAC